MNADITKDLKFTSNFGVDYRVTNQNLYNPEFYVSNNENREVSELTEKEIKTLTGYGQILLITLKQLINTTLVSWLVWRCNTIHTITSATGYDVPFNEDMRYLQGVKTQISMQLQLKVQVQFNRSLQEQIIAMITSTYYNTMRMDGSSKFARKIGGVISLHSQQDGI